MREVLRIVGFLALALSAGLAVPRGIDFALGRQEVIELKNLKPIYFDETSFMVCGRIVNIGSEASPKDLRVEVRAPRAKDAYDEPGYFWWGGEAEIGQWAQFRFVLVPSSFWNAWWSDQIEPGARAVELLNVHPDRESCLASLREDMHSPSIYGDAYEK